MIQGEKNRYRRCWTRDIYTVTVVTNPRWFMFAFTVAHLAEFRSLGAVAAPINAFQLTSPAHL